MSSKRVWRLATTWLGVSVAAAGLAAASAPTAANAATIDAPITSTSQSYTTAGVSAITVPSDIASIDLDGVGGAGFSGDDSFAAKGGTGGSGTHVHMQFSPSDANGVHAGDSLQVVVGSKGGGGWRGYGDSTGGSGGNGGGATYVVDVTTGKLLLVAGGGGGGGGGGSIVGYNGGAGGNQRSGAAGISDWGQPGGAGGALGQSGTCGSAGLSFGTPGGTANTASAAAGGGGGGGGACGGLGGGNGNGSFSTTWGPGGGGGGGAGASLAAYGATVVERYNNTGAGSAAVTFGTYVHTVPQITSASCVSLAHAADFKSYHFQASGYPVPTFGASGAPGWIGVHPDGSVQTNYLDDTPNEYQFQVSAQNDRAVAVQNFAVAIGSAVPTFMSAASATAYANTPFGFQVKAVGCPAVSSYRMDSILPAGLAFNTTTGQLSGTPAQQAIGTYRLK
ncbi:MAG: hypothetical protein JWP02_715, partial [Acidimicrobiales bacterium]|nr:hypothetical protein [Acidimicrobiales bacterium]